MIRFLIELSMFGSSVFTIIHIIKTIKLKNQKKNRKTPKLSELKEKDFGGYIDDLTKELH